MNEPQDNIEAIRIMRDQAQELPPLDQAIEAVGVMHPKSHTLAGQLDADSDIGGVDGPAPSEIFLPNDCPVQPLGMQDDVYYYLDQLGQLRALKARDHSRLNLQSMFGRLSDLLSDERYWPRMTLNKATGEWIVTGWKPEEAARCLMGEAARKGVWNPNERVRGAGAWKDADGSLVLHMGDRLLQVVAEPGRPGGALKWKGLEPGIVGRMVYPTAPAGLRPARETQAHGPKGVGARVLQLFSTWNWRRKDLDPYLLLGWVACAFLGGAIRWRPLIWTTGGKGTGKSSLEDAIKWLFGEVGLLHTSDATAAAVRQILRHASLPVAIDEAEADEDNRRMNQLIKLARDAATGALAVRGGADHQASQFTIRSCFMFTSILVPPLLPQDKSRMAILELDQLDPAKPIPKEINPENMTELGQRLLRRLVDAWPRWSDTVIAYRSMLAASGHSARGQDVFGSLLAGAHVLLWDEAPSAEELKGWALRLKPSNLAELEGAVDDQDACLVHLLSTVVEDTHIRQRHPIGHWIGRAVKRFGADHQGAEYARELLQEHGLKIVDKDGETWVAVANFHRGLTRIFDRTQWAARPGAMGVWVQSLRRLPHKPSDKALWFGAASRATLLPLDLCLPRPGGAGQDAPAAAQATPGAGATPAEGSVLADAGGNLGALQAAAERSAAGTTGAEWEDEAWAGLEADANHDSSGSNPNSDDRDFGDALHAPGPDPAAP